MIKESVGCDQSYARTVNNELVIQKLCESDYSATDLARELDLSHAAISSILKGLVNDRIIKASYSSSTAGKGRKRVFYSLNEAYGLIIVVSLSNNRYQIIISNIREEILLEETDEIAGNVYFTGYTKEYVKIAVPEAEGEENILVKGIVTGRISADVYRMENIEKAE